MEEVSQLYKPRAEEALLGALVINPSLLDQIDLNEGDFYITQNSLVFGALKVLWMQGKNVDFVMLCDYLEASGKLQDAGGAAYVTGLISATPGTQGALDYAQVIRDMANRRNTIRLASELVQGAYNEKVSLDDAIGNVLTGLSKNAGAGKGAQHWNAYLSKAYDMIEERSKNPAAVWGISTGFTDYDILTGGLQSAELLLVSGQPGIGKSRMVLQAGVQMARKNHPGAIYSLEMIGEAYAMRAIAAEAKIESRRLKSGRLQDGDWEKIIAGIESLSFLPLYMSDDTSWTTAALRADLARLKRKHSIEWFAVDYSYLVQDGQGVLDETERSQIVISNLKLICKSLRLAGIVIHSLNKSGMDNSAPGQSSLRGSGQVSYDADVILYMLEHKTNGQPDPNLVTCLFRKGRELEADKKYFHLVKVPGTTFFGNYTKSPMQPDSGKLQDLKKEAYYG